MANFEQYLIIGHVGKDAEMRFAPNGEAVTSFSVAVSRNWMDEQGQWHGKTKWIRVSAWGKLAETCEKLKKGQNVLVSGQLNGDEHGNPRTWKGQDGTVRANFEMTAELVRLLEKREKEGEEAQAEGEASF